MSSWLFLTQFLLLVQSAIENPSAEWEEDFDHYTFLSPAEDYRLYWTVLKDESIEIGLEVESTGWVGFGISDNGLMVNGDIILGWIENGVTYLQRRHTTNSRTDGPIFDEDIIEDLISSEQNGTITRLRFTREMYPCADSENPNRKQIIIGTTQIIFAKNNNNPTVDENNPNGMPQMHDLNSMGKQSINFLTGGIIEVPMPSDAQSFEFTMANYTIPQKDTIYYCRFIEMPQELTGVNHLIRADPIVQEGNEGTVHHMILYWCKTFNTSYIGFETECNDFANMNFDGSECTQEQWISGWAIGGGDYYWPQNVGQPIFGKVYALLEIHYDNPNEIEGIVDSSGMRIWWTPTLREYNSSLVSVGARYSSTWIPGDISESVKIAYHSAPECTINIPEEGIYVFSGNPHAHTIGVKMRLRHIRNNIELPPIFRDDAYDFNYQQTTSVSPQVLILPGDEFICECEFETDRKYPTYGGQSSQEEMCICFFSVYPSTERIWTYSRSEFTAQQYADFFDIAIDNEWWNGSNIWSDNKANALSYYYNGQADGALEHFRNFVDVEERYAYCSNFQGFMTIPEAREEFKPLEGYDICAVESTDDDKLLTTTQIIIIATIGGVLLILLIVTGIYCKYKRNKSDKTYEAMSEEQQESYGAATAGKQ